jgi:hypothetical protein
MELLNILGPLGESIDPVSTDCKWQYRYLNCWRKHVCLNTKKHNVNQDGWS